MGQFVEMSRIVAQGMRGINPRYSVKVEPFSTHQESAKARDGKASFEISQVSFQVPVGTYLDSPRTRDPGGRDIAALDLGDLILPGLCLDCRAHGTRAFGAVEPGDLPPAAALKGRAVLFDFGRAAHYGEPAYDADPPFLAKATVDALVAAGARLVGVDNRSPDDPRDLSRYAHTHLLRAGILIVENLHSMERVRGRDFRFFAIPARVKDATSFPIRAFAEIGNA